ncbi:MmcQ/YjbR family DNA-binding protein [Nocardioides pantholopis]|uniref:MmcQ/YjbR family DNA-binding protein n=1 Tax=Nocardioides pantholopis TaxID=2483798 RepID=UPI000F07CF87|nr:MmcQ/YjbR family DNA-binding protein [Nocardioides pantholopis]
MTAERRPARPEDVDEICRSLPEVELGTSWGDVPTYLVRGRGFVLFRKPDHHALDPATGAPYDDLLVIVTAGPGETRALLADQRLPFFTIEHFERTRSNAVLVSQSRLGEIDRDELAEVITEAWAARAPKRLVREHLGDG